MSGGAGGGGSTPGGHIPQLAEAAPNHDLVIGVEACSKGVQMGEKDPTFAGWNVVERVVKNYRAVWGKT